MKRKHNLLLILLSIISSSIYSQETKTSKTEYETYHYYEDANLNQVRSGIYSYNESRKGFKYTITGHFKNGKRTGLWLWRIAVVDYSPNGNNPYITSTRKLSINYVDGLPNGTVTASYIGKTRRMSYGSWSQYVHKNPYSFTAHFSHGQLSGSFSANDGFNEKSNGKFDSNGIAIGRFTSINLLPSGGTTVQEYKNGMVIKYTGQDNTDSTLILARQYVNGTIDSTELANLDYYIKPITPIGNISTHIGRTMYRDIFKHDKITGDLFYSDFDGGIAYTVKKKLFIDVKGSSEYRSGKRGMEYGSYSSALEDFESLIELNSDNISKSDMKLLKSKIFECTRLLKIQEKERIEKERLAKIEAEKLAAERLIREKLAKIEAERLAAELARQTEYNYQKSKLNQYYDKSTKQVYDLYVNESVTKAREARATNVYSTSNTFNPKMNKSKLYYAYVNLSNMYVHEMNSIVKYDLESVNELTIKYTNLINFIIEYRELDTKKLEKSLKSIDDPIEIEHILQEYF